ncbi:MAG: GNAT family N-acetyltransferase [Candidatus Hermodarchaeota archaeon]
MHKLLLEIPSKFETDRLVLRMYEKGDGRHLFELLERGNNRELLKEHLDEAREVLTLDDAEIIVRKHAAEWISRERFVMGIWLKENEAFTGEIWIEPKNWEIPLFELGYYIDPERGGEGIATEAAKRSVKFLFDDLKAHKVIIITRDTNEKSWKLAERLGFRREGHLRECGIKNGKRWGLYHYGLLRDELEEE